jgi:antitoxin component of MazEF toxin-antitoxin module
MLRRRMGGVGDPPTPIVHVPALYARLEGLRPGDEIAIGFDGGVLVISPVEREATAVRLLKGLRSEPRGAPFRAASIGGRLP